MIEYFFCERLNFFGKKFFLIKGKGLNYVFTKKNFRIRNKNFLNACFMLGHLPDRKIVSSSKRKVRFLKFLI